MNRDRSYLLHVRDAIRRIREYTRGGEHDFFEDTRTQDAVIRNLEIIGEAVKRIDSRLTQRHSDVQWKRIAGMRDRMIHDYLGVNLEIVWQTVINDIPSLDRRIEEILTELDP